MNENFFTLPYHKVAFDLPLRAYESRLLRSAVLTVIKSDDSLYKILYHNHIDDGVRYGYPLIQYKVISGKGAILYLGKGIESIHLLFGQQPRTVVVRNRKIELKVDKIYAKAYKMFLVDNFYKYKIRNWLPLQDENFYEYRRLKTEQEKHNFLQKILRGNILSFAKGVGWFVNGELKIQDFQVSKTFWISYKKVKFLGFDVYFKTNCKLPPHIGLGKGSAHNYGVLFPQKVNEYELTK